MGLNDEYYGRYRLMFDEHTFFVWDNDKEERLCALDVTRLLNNLTNQNNKQEIQSHQLIRLIMEMEELIHNESLDRIIEIREYPKKYKKELKKRINRIIAMSEDNYKVYSYNPKTNELLYGLKSVCEFNSGEIIKRLNEYNDKVNDLETSNKKFKVEDKRLCDVISGLHDEIRLYHDKLHKQNKILSLQNEIIEFYKEMVKVYDDDFY